jgi:hypothetical protein
MMSPITATVGGLREIAEIVGVAFAVERIAEFAKEMAELDERTLNASAALGLSLPKYVLCRNTCNLYRPSSSPAPMPAPRARAPGE